MKKMLPDERKNEIYKKIQKEGSIKVDEISNLFNVSDMTIRRDLEKMEEEGLIKRTHGGAVKNSDILLDLDVEDRIKKNIEKKDAIANKALEFIEKDEFLGLDASTTVLRFSKVIPDRDDIVIVTNGMLLPKYLINRSNLKIINTGGETRKDALSSVGSITEDVIKRFNYTKVFISANAVNLKNGLNDTNISEIGVKRTFINNSEAVIALIDSTKLEKKAFSVTCDLSEIDKLITDNGADKEIIQNYKEKGVDIIVAE